MTDGTARAIAKAVAAAPAAVDTLVAVTKEPSRNSAAQVTAARVVLEAAGVLGARADFDRERRAFIERMRARLSPEDFDRFILAATDDTLTATADVVAPKLAGG